MTTLRTAIVGLGFMGRTHLQMLRRLGVEVSGILGITAEEGQKFAQDYHVARVYRDFDEILADPQVNAVHICTPNALHYPLSRAALLAGKHVICEKPLATNSQESGQLVDLARQTGLVAAVNYNLRHYPLTQDAHARFHAGELGEARLIYGGYLQDWLFLPTDWNWRLEAEAGGALRAVSDIGTHWMDMVTWVTGLKIVEVMAELATFINPRYKPLHEVAAFDGKLAIATDSQPVMINTEDLGIVLLRFDNGARGVFTVSQISAGRKNNFWWEVTGSKASMRWDQENPNHLWMGYRERPNEIVIKDPSLMYEESRSWAAFPGGHAEGYPDTFFQNFKTFYQAVADGKPLDSVHAATFVEGHRQMVLCEAILRSVNERRWVPVE